MTITEISKMPTCIDNVHESALKAYQILEKVKVFLRAEVRSDLILELIEEMELTIEGESNE